MRNASKETEIDPPKAEDQEVDASSQYMYEVSYMWEEWILWRQHELDVMYVAKIMTVHVFLYVVQHWLGVKDL